MLHGCFRVHLELVSTFSTEAFLLTLKRFISRRGIPAVIHSDNATNYVGARNHLRELREFFAKSQLSKSLKVFATETGFDWKFIPPSSPHWGGLWEALVKGAKGHLYRIIGNSQLTYLNRLQNRPKWLSPAKKLEINALVSLKEDDVPPLKWPLARIVEIIHGSDQRVHAVKLRTRGSVFVRHITKV
ncbi:hypothetical protein JTB14_021656 [Gonioctena quinquepunctata]|nr:hypothetical protein JTB14_021656 [Gonioctena quinquepunctata]